ncbi:MAG: twin-arginine translocase TatA/TatE family subunit [Armatimonadetes bacterium]|nr:twin-arginine translocase TatA/TatE family subunit [Armatimonadota bacterium]MBS1700380.1 twin-arginine translocase TatA/TatE family subunit [Armatimonadota bacterium]MBS1725409.1 twin-arginine translocase TatA/TatE family subunit [Armatimonadota bacterium]
MNNLPFAAFGLPGGSEIWVILVLVVLLFGGAKIPQLMRGVGQGVGELKRGLEEGKKAFEDSSKDDPKKDEKKED